jgi:putative PEP-CTERM system histidine kinase
MESLMGFVVLANPLIARSINWEDRDLLKTAANQVAGHLALLMTSDDLARAKQFEVFNRLSAYMVHDLKNVAAELELVARNADKHKSNPAFLDDAFETVDNAATGIKKLLDQLRSRQLQSEKKGITDLGKLLKDVIDTKRDQSPTPQLDAFSGEYIVAVEKDRLTSVLAHLIDNAQQATEDEGEVRIKLSSRDSMHIVEIKDTGHGMDEDFIRNRLFEPFDTTKGNAGMGIGMHESREFMRYLGGEITVDSKLEEGTVISLHIPANQDVRVHEPESGGSDNG